MRIVTWNVNGINACLESGMMKYIERVKADICCFQETKTVTKIDSKTFHQYWNPAKRKGYSGTLILSKESPLSIRKEIGYKKFDEEGRIIIAEYAEFYVINVYIPNSTRSPQRKQVRYESDEKLREFLLTLDKPVVLCGDFNVAYSNIDIYPENLKNKNDDFGFLSMERDSMSELFKIGFVDCFRHFYPEKEGCYTWWSTRFKKRLVNQGWRLDYFLISKELVNSIDMIRHDVDTLGSDHCPVLLQLNLRTPVFNESSEKYAKMWNEIDFEKYEDTLFRYQKELTRYAKEKNFYMVKKLQNTIVTSMEAKCLAVNHVANHKNEPGIDRVSWKKPEEKMKAALSLTSHNYWAKPFRTFKINDNGKERVVKVPCNYDSAIQVLYTYSLEPVHEALSDPKSFAFRKGRSQYDCHSHILGMFDKNNPPEWVLRGDIKSYYNRINHNFLLDNIPMEKNVLRKFLKSGFFEDDVFFPSADEGITMGSSLSPIIANMTLDGLKNHIYKNLYFDYDSIDYSNGDMIRFADDIVVSARTKVDAENIKKIISEFLYERGLSFNEEKTYITHISEGFDFLSRRYVLEKNKITSHPTDEAVERFENHLNKYVEDFKGSQERLIKAINKKLTGWSTYHRVSDAYEAFKKIDLAVHAILIRKMRTIHPTWSWDDIKNKYWQKTSDDEYYFVLKDNPTIRVMHLKTSYVVDHKPVKVTFNPFLDEEYYEWIQFKREIKKRNGEIYKGIWNREDGECYICGEKIKENDDVELIEKNLHEGRNISNLAYVHKKCLNINNFEEKDLEYDVFDDLKEICDNVLEYKPLKLLSDFFRVSHKTPLTLTFKEMENIIGRPLPHQDYIKSHFLTKKDEEDYSNDSKENYQKNLISSAWEKQGYYLWNVNFRDKKIIFRRIDEDRIGLKIPKKLMTNKIPIKAVYEAEEFFKYLIKKYGL